MPCFVLTDISAVPCMRQALSSVCTSCYCWKIIVVKVNTIAPDLYLKGKHFPFLYPFFNCSQFFKEQILSCTILSEFVRMVYTGKQIEKASISSSMLPDPIEFRVYCTYCYF